MKRRPKERTSRLVPQISFFARLNSLGCAKLLASPSIRNDCCEVVIHAHQDSHTLYVFLFSRPIAENYNCCTFNPMICLRILTVLDGVWREISCSLGSYWYLRRKTAEIPARVRLWYHLATPFPFDLDVGPSTCHCHFHILYRTSRSKMSWAWSSF